MFRIFIFLLTGWSCFAFGTYDPYSVAVSMGEPSALIEGCVSAITGHFYHIQEDAVIEGAEPLHLFRSYMSLKNRDWRYYNLSTEDEFYLGGWRLIKPLEAFVFEDRVDIPDDNGTLLTYIIPLRPNSPKISFESKKHKKKRKEEAEKEKNATKTLLLPDELIKTGLTNCSKGEISGKTNCINNKVQMEGSHILKVFEANGKIKCYYREDAGRSSSFGLQYEQLPNGNRINYSYCTISTRPFFQVLSEISTTNHDGSKVYAWARFYLEDSGDCRIETSDGRSIKYHYEKYNYLLNHKKQGPKSHGISFSLLKSINSPEYRENFDYYLDKKQTEPTLKLFSFDNGRQFSPQFYLMGKKNTDLSRKIEFRSPGDPRFLRVRSLYAPVCSDAALHRTHQIFYEIDKKKDKKSSFYGGQTTVYDADNNKTVYYYNGDLRLCKIERYAKEDLHSSELFAWGQAEYKEAAYLLARSYADAQGKIVFSRRFFYDGWGNVTLEKFYGNITGKAAVPLQLDKDSLPLDNGSEYSSRMRKYSTDGRNLPLEEREENGKTTVNTYHPVRHLLLS